MRGCLTLFQVMYFMRINAEYYFFLFLRLIMKPHNERQYLRDQLAAFHISASKLIDMIHH